jgi:hypothetical protein
VWAGGSGVNLAAVPEPAPVFLLGFLVGAISMRRRMTYAN